MADTSSRRRFSEALERVMEEKPLAKIRVGDILSASGLSRQTFYRQFRDIYDLIDWTHMEKVRLAFELTKVCDDIEMGWTVNLRLMTQSRAFYQQVVTTTGYNSFYNGYFLRCEKNLLAYIGMEDTRDEGILFTARFLAAGITHMTLEWIGDGMVIPPDIMAHRLTGCLSESYMKLYRARRGK